MNLMDALTSQTPAPTGADLSKLLFALLAAFIVGQLNAWCYQWTHRGVSYSRTFTQALLLISLLGAFSMSLIGNNVVYAFGLLGALAIIRFRTIVRDARDSAYILLSLLSGMAAGFGHYAGALFGTLVFNAIAFYLCWTGFGTLYGLDSLLRFQLHGTDAARESLDPVLRTYCRRHSIVSLDEAPRIDANEPAAYQYVYKIRLRDPESGPNLVAALRSAFTIDAVHLLVQQENEEVM